MVQIQVELNEIKKNQLEMMRQMHFNGPSQDDDFIAKFSMTLPIKTHGEFDILEEKLQHSEFRQEFVNMLLQKILE